MHQQIISCCWIVPINNGIIYKWILISAYQWIQDGDIICVGKLIIQEHQSTEILSHHLSKQKEKKKSDWKEKMKKRERTQDDAE